MSSKLGEHLSAQPASPELPSGPVVPPRPCGPMGPGRPQVTVCSPVRHARDGSVPTATATRARLVSRQPVSGRASSAAIGAPDAAAPPSTAARTSAATVGVEDLSWCDGEAQRVDGEGRLRGAVERRGERDRETGRGVGYDEVQGQPDQIGDRAVDQVDPRGARASRPCVQTMSCGSGLPTDR